MIPVHLQSEATSTLISGATSFRALVNTGELRLGDRASGEREFAVQLGSHRTTVATRTRSRSEV